MVLPLVPLALWGVGITTGASGAGLIVKGGFNIKTARSRVRVAQEHCTERRRKLEARERETNAALKSLGSEQARALCLVVDRMAEFLRRHEKQVTDSEKLLVDGLESAPGQVALDSRLGQDAVSWMRGVVASTLAGVGVRSGLTAAVTTFGTASTGTAISTLSGAAATNATLAALGGGSISAGGGGMAAGAAALNVVTAGPALLITGFTIAKQGEKSKTKASEIEAEVNIEIATMNVTDAKFETIAKRASELETLLRQLVERAALKLDLLESEEFDPERHARRFQHALFLTLAVRDVASTSIVDDSNTLNEETATIEIRYRLLVEEVQHV